jgi:hypothetical protein
LGKSVKKGFKITQCNSITPNSAEPLSFDFEYLAENKSNGESMTYTLTTPKFPATDEQANTIADKILEDEIGKKPETEIARRNSYAWRIDRKKAGTTATIKAFLEMTLYTIDVDLKEEPGEKIDPAAELNNDFYYGNSDFE